MEQWKDTVRDTKEERIDAIFSVLDATLHIKKETKLLSNTKQMQSFVVSSV